MDVGAGKNTHHLAGAGQAKSMRLQSCGLQVHEVDLGSATTFQVKEAGHRKALEHQEALVEDGEEVHMAGAANLSSTEK